MSSTKEMSKRQMRREQIRRKESRGKWVGISLVSLGAILVAFLFIYPNFKPIGDISTPEPLSRPDAKFNATGNPDAPIKIEEYSDFQCPYCGNFYKNTEAQLIEKFVVPGTVYFVYHSFGEFIGPESASSAEAAYCAGDQNKFWEMHDTIFANQLGENAGAFADRNLTAFAQTIDGLDMGEFNTCFKGGNYSSLVAQDQKDGFAADLKSTPSFLISYTVNGEVKTKKLEGALPISDFEQAISEALAEIGK